MEAGVDWEVVCNRLETGIDCELSRIAASATRTQREAGSDRLRRRFEMSWVTPQIRFLKWYKEAKHCVVPVSDLYVHLSFQVLHMSSPARLMLSITC
jgi:hypothetical protein